MLVELGLVLEPGCTLNGYMLLTYDCFECESHNRCSWGQCQSWSLQMGDVPIRMLFYEVWSYISVQSWCYAFIPVSWSTSVGHTLQKSKTNEIS